MDPLPICISSATGVPRYRQIVDQVTELIRSGELQPGARLPSVRDLARQLLVSLITTRRAYAELEAGGLIERVQGRGTFVAEDAADLPRAAAVDEARERFGDALRTARRLGLDEAEIRALVDDILGGGR